VGSELCLDSGHLKSLFLSRKLPPHRHKLNAKTRHMCSIERTTIYYIHHQYITHMVCYENITCAPHAYSIFSVLLACWTFCSRSHEIPSCLLEMSTFGIHLT
jgi:hypothetical protein